MPVFDRKKYVAAARRRYSQFQNSWVIIYHQNQISCIPICFRFDKKNDIISQKLWPMIIKNHINENILIGMFLNIFDLLITCNNPADLLIT